MQENGPKQEQVTEIRQEQLGVTIKGGDFPIRTLADDPDKLVRTESLVGTAEETVEHYQNIKEWFGTMKDVYGIKVPDMDIAQMTGDEDKSHIYLLVDKIIGTQFGETEKLPEESQIQFETFYSGLLQSALDAYQAGRPFFKDIKGENFMYGHKANDPDAADDFYLFDVGGGFQEGDHVEFHGQIIKTDYNEAFSQLVENAENDLAGYEKQFGGVELKKIRKKLAEMEKVGAIK